MPRPIIPGFSLYTGTGNHMGEQYLLSNHSDPGKPKLAIPVFPTYEYEGEGLIAKTPDGDEVRLTPSHEWFA